MRRYKYFSDGTIIKTFVSVGENIRKKNATLDRGLSGVAASALYRAAQESSKQVGAIQLEQLVYKPAHAEALGLFRKVPNKKTYYITGAIRRKISSSAAKMALNKEPGENLLFITLTFSGYVNEKEANTCWSKFAENLKLNYQLSGYVCVKELHDSGIPHFHCILKIPFQDLSKLNDAWVHTFPERLKYSNCALRTDKKNGAKIKNVKKAVQYCTKYMSKNATRGVKYAERCYFIDHNSLDSGNYISEQLLKYILDSAKQDKKTVHIWSHPERPVEIWTIYDSFATYEQYMTETYGEFT